MFTKSVHFTTDDDPNRAQFLTLLGACLGLRSVQIKTIQDLNAGIEAIEESVVLTADDDTEHNARTAMLSRSLLLRHVETGSLDDLRVAIELLRQALGNVKFIDF